MNFFRSMEIDPTCKFSPPQSRSEGISFYGFSAPRRFQATKTLNGRSRLVLFFLGQQGRERGDERGRSDITVCLLQHYVSMDDATKTNDIGPARSGGQISHAISNHGDIPVR